MKHPQYLILAIAAFAMNFTCVSCDKDDSFDDNEEVVLDPNEKPELSTTELSLKYGEQMDLYLHVEKKGGDFGDAIIYNKAHVVNGEIEGPLKYIDESADSYTFYAWADCTGKGYDVELLRHGIHVKGITKEDAQKFYVTEERNVPTSEFSDMMTAGLTKQLHFQSLHRLAEGTNPSVSVTEIEGGGCVVNMK